MIGTACAVPYFIKINCAECLPFICAWQTKSLNGKDAMFSAAL
jgi:hypothetical protein